MCDICNKNAKYILRYYIKKNDRLYTLNTCVECLLTFIESNYIIYHISLHEEVIDGVSIKRAEIHKLNNSQLIFYKPYNLSIYHTIDESFLNKFKSTKFYDIKSIQYSELIKAPSKIINNVFNELNLSTKL